jgi:hypothetical protein
MLFWYPRQIEVPGASDFAIAPDNAGVSHQEAVEAGKRRWDSNATIGLYLVLVGTLLEAVPPACTAIGSWRRRPIVPQVQTREDTELHPEKRPIITPRAEGALQMSTPPQTDVNAARISDQTERVLHDFIREAVRRLSEALNDAGYQSAPTFDDDIRLERGDDGNFRERKKRIRTLRPTFSAEWLHSLPDYEQCVECLRSDEVVGPHLDRFLGTSEGSRRLEAENIATRLIYAMLDDEGSLTFTSEKFHSKWRELADFFSADRIAYKTVAPLPYLVAPTFPLRLNDELVLDRLTEDEVTRCYQVGVIRPNSLQFPLVYGGMAVGIRRTTLLPKLIRRGVEPLGLAEAEDEGSFGKRPPLRGDLTIDDVLSAFRLFKHTQLRCPGLAIWTDAPWLAGTLHSRILGRWPYGLRFELSEDEAPQLLELWHLLEEGGAVRFDFVIRRFNLAFDRALLDDRIVDLVIAAEALFLGDLDDQFRGELRFRFALRAAKFIEHPSYSEREVFGVMLRAYDARSAIVHGGSPKKTHLPGNRSADLPTFTDAIEDLVRLGLRKALSMKQDGNNIRQIRVLEHARTLKCRPTIEPGRSP